MKHMTRIAWFLLLPLLCLGPVARVVAQTGSFQDELFSLLPDDFAVCVAMHDLRGQSRRWERSDWFKSFRASPLGKTLLDAPELQMLTKWEKELKKHFDLDLPTLRDDIFGDTVVLAYRPGAPNHPEDEQGLFLVQARNPERMTRFIDQFNDVQKKSGELKSLSAVKHNGVTYYQRVDDKKTQFYFTDGPLLAFSTKEEMIRGVLDKRAQTARPNPWAKRFRRAGAERAFATLCVNPRGVRPDFLKHAKKDDPFPGYWQALEGIFVTVTIQDDAELRLSIQADGAALPKWTRSAFFETAEPSRLWQRFPEESIVTMASRVDFAGTVEALKALMPEKDRKKVESDLQRSLGVFLQRDLFKDVLPNIGPDWGLCVMPAKDSRHLPQVLIALAVKPGSKDPPVDQSVLKTVDFFARLGVIQYNQSHPDEIRLQTIKQDKVEVMFLSNDKVFPPGIQPACALKDGFLLIATSPEAVLRFTAREVKYAPRQETPLLRLSTQELARVLGQRHEEIVSSLQTRHQMDEPHARKNLQSVIALLGLFEQVTLSHRAEAGQASWMLRITPKAGR